MDDYQNKSSILYIIILAIVCAIPSNKLLITVDKALKEILKIELYNSDFLLLIIISQ